MVLRDSEHEAGPILKAGEAWQLTVCDAPRWHVLVVPMRPALKLCILLPCAAAAASNSELIATLLTGYDRQLRPSAWLSGGESAAPEHVDVQMYVEIDRMVVTLFRRFELVPLV